MSVEAKPVRRECSRTRRLTAKNPNGALIIGARIIPRLAIDIGGRSGYRRSMHCAAPGLGYKPARALPDRGISRRNRPIDSWRAPAYAHLRELQQRKCLKPQLGARSAVARRKEVKGWMRHMSPLVR